MVRFKFKIYVLLWFKKVNFNFILFVVCCSSCLELFNVLFFKICLSHSVDCPNVSLILLIFWIYLVVLRLWVEINSFYRSRLLIRLVASFGEKFKFFLLFLKLNFLFSSIFSLSFCWKLIIESIILDFIRPNILILRKFDSLDGLKLLQCFCFLSDIWLEAALFNFLNLLFLSLLLNPSLVL